MSKLTHRGYTVFKSQLTDAEVKMIRKDLLVEPFNPVQQKMMEARKKD